MDPHMIEAFILTMVIIAAYILSIVMPILAVFLGLTWVVRVWKESGKDTKHND